MHFQFDYSQSVTIYELIFAAVARCIIKHLFYEQPDRYYFKGIKMT